jgi:hypothetical protein
LGWAEWFSWVVLPTSLLAWWLHWRATKTAEVRLVLVEINRLLDDVIAARNTSVGPALDEAGPRYEEMLGVLIDDLHDQRLAFRCKAVLADSRRALASGRVEDAQAGREHVGDALDRIRHLERLTFRRS